MPGAQGRGEQGSRGSLLSLSPLSGADAAVLRDNFFLRFILNAGTEGGGKLEAFCPEDTDTEERAQLGDEEKF